MDLFIYEPTYVSFIIDMSIYFYKVPSVTCIVTAVSKFEKNDTIIVPDKKLRSATQPYRSIFFW